MFYVKSEISEGITLRTEINSENTFTICPACGFEFPVDLVDILSGGNADLYSTAVYCHKCSVKRAQQCRGTEWAEQLAQEE